MNYELASAIRNHSDGPGLSCGQWYDKTITHAPVIRTPADRVETRVGEYCCALGLLPHQSYSCESIGRRLVQLGDDEETAVRKACELAGEISKHRSEA